MAQYRGTLTGQRGSASRLGSKTSGLSAHIASWQGAVDVDLWHNNATGIDMARVTLARHHNAGSDRVLYEGPVSGEGCQASSGWNVLVIGRNTTSDICLDCGAIRSDHKGVK